MKKKTRTIEILEAKVLHKHGGKIDLKKLWEDEDKEADPKVIAKLANDFLPTAR